MPTWGELLQELIGVRGEFAATGPREDGPAPVDVLRRKYLKRLSERTGRATILYYSGFQQNPDAPPNALAVSPADMTGFMETCSNVKERELDLFLHSPGGNPDAVEQICEYLRTRFDHIRAIVPLNAMSAATMTALSADEILMGAHSQLGPIDPQLTVAMPEGPRTASAQAIKDQFALAVEQCKEPGNLNAATMSFPSPATSCPVSSSSYASLPSPGPSPARSKSVPTSRPSPHLSRPPAPSRAERPARPDRRRIDSVRGGIRSSFEAIPDAPLSKVVLSMQGGKKGLIVNSRNQRPGRSLPVRAAACPRLRKSRPSGLMAKSERRC